MAYALKLGSAARTKPREGLVSSVGSKGQLMRMHLVIAMFVGLLFVLAPQMAAGATNPDTEPTTQAPVAVQRVAVPSRGLRDEAAMVLIGTALIGLAAAVRRVA